MNIGRAGRTQAGARGFTLIELLVVIAIIAILAAILFPVFAKARENARKTNCLSNIKQMGLGIQQYAQDYDERLPAQWQNSSPVTHTAYGQTAVTNYFTWPELIGPYTKNNQMFQCPSKQWAVMINYNSYPTAYHYNSNSSGYSCSGVSLAQVTTPANTIMLFDGWGTMDSGGWTTTNLANLLSGNADAVATAALSTTVRRHMDGANVGFVDGHAKWLRSATPSQFTTTEDPD